MSWARPADWADLNPTDFSLLFGVGPSPAHCSPCEQRQWRRRRRRRRRRRKGREESYLARWRSGRGGRRAVVRPTVGAGFRWQSRKKEGEENLQERERDRRCMLCCW